MKSKGLVQQLVSFLADEKVGLAGGGLAFLAIANENPRIEAIGHTIDIVHFIAERIEKTYGPGVATLEVCSAPLSAKLPQGYPTLSIIGARSDLETKATRISIDDLLKPYELGTKSIPGFPAISLPPIGDSKPQQHKLLDKPRWDITSGKNSQEHPVWAPGAPIPVLATLSGMVLDEHGNPIAGAVVSLTASSITSAQPQWRMTLYDGSYSFADPPGTYFISARLGSSISGGKLDSGSQTVTLTTRFPSKVNLYVHPQTRAEIEEEVTPEQKGMIIDFIVAADDAETRADDEGDPRYLEDFYTGEALEYVRDHFDKKHQRGEVAWLDAGHVEAIRYSPKTFTILVETVEVWSHTLFDVRTGQKLKTYSGSASPQTITIRQTPQGWYINKVQFHHVTEGVR